MTNCYAHLFCSLRGKHAGKYITAVIPVKSVSVDLLPQPSSGSFVMLNLSAKVAKIKESQLKKNMSNGRVHLQNNLFFFSRRSAIFHTDLAE
jgi:hypothetical protein